MCITECNCDVCTGNVDFKEEVCQYCDYPLDECDCEMCDYCDSRLHYECGCTFCDNCGEEEMICLCEHCDECGDLEAFCDCGIEED